MGSVPTSTATGSDGSVTRDAKGSTRSIRCVCVCVGVRARASELYLVHVVAENTEEMRGWFSSAAVVFLFETTCTLSVLLLTLWFLFPSAGTRHLEGVFIPAPQQTGELMQVAVPSELHET